MQRQTFIAGVLGMSAVVCMTAPSRADSTFAFTYTDPNTVASGILHASSNGNGSFTAYSGSIDVVSGLGVPMGTYDLYYPQGNGTQAFYSPSGQFIADDQLYPSGSPELDTYGLLFRNSIAPAIEINLWGNSPGSPYTGYSWTDSHGYTYSGDFLGSFNLQLIPLPSSCLLSAGSFAGLGLIGGLRRPRRGDE